VKCIIEFEFEIEIEVRSSRKGTKAQRKK